MTSHDRLFKELLKTFFLEFLELFFPEVAAYIDPQSIEFLDKEVFTDVTRGERHVVDLVAKARFRGQETGFLLHAEAQGRQQDHFPSRMFVYFARLNELHHLPVYPIAIFTYSWPLKGEPTDYAVNFPDLEVLRFRYRTVQLNQLNWRDFLRSQNPIACALMARMRIKKQDRPKVKLECLRLLATLKLNPAKQQLISGFVDSYLRLNQKELIIFNDEIAKLDIEEEQEVLKFTTSWKEEGRLEGRLEGKTEGLLKGLEPAFRLRFGDEGAAFLDSLRESADPRTLERLAKLVLTAKDLPALQRLVAKKPRAK